MLITSNSTAQTHFQDQQQSHNKQPLANNSCSEKNRLKLSNFNILFGASSIVCSQREARWLLIVVVGRQKSFARCIFNFLFFMFCGHLFRNISTIDWYANHSSPHPTMSDVQTGEKRFSRHVFIIIITFIENIATVASITHQQPPSLNIIYLSFQWVEEEEEDEKIYELKLYFINEFMRLVCVTHNLYLRTTTWINCETSREILLYIFILLYWF